MMKRQTISCSDSKVVMIDSCMVEKDDGEWLPYHENDEQVSEAIYLARLPLLEAIKDLEEQVRILREESERRSGVILMLVNVLRENSESCSRAIRKLE